MVNVTSGTSFELNSEYVQASQQFIPTTKTVMYVESHKDVAFWYKLFNDNNNSIDIKPIGRDFAANGKQMIISLINNESIKPGNHLLIAIDSDFDYLLGLQQDIYAVSLREDSVTLPH